jgi:hypothetical protein
MILQNKLVTRKVVAPGPGGVPPGGLRRKVDRTRTSLNLSLKMLRFNFRRWQREVHGHDATPF